MTINLVAHSIKHNKIYQDTPATKQLADQYNWSHEEYITPMKKFEQEYEDTQGGKITSYHAIPIYNPCFYTATVGNGLHIVDGFCHKQKKFIRNLHVEIDIYSLVTCQETERFKQAQVHVVKEPQPHGVTDLWGKNRSDLEEILTTSTPLQFRYSVQNGLLCSSRRADFSKHKKFVLNCPDVQYLGNFERLVAYFDCTYFGPCNPATHGLDIYVKFEALSISPERVFSWPYSDEAMFNVIGGNPENVDIHNPDNIVPYPNTQQRREIRNNAYDENGLGINPEEERLVVQGPVGATEHRNPVQMSVPQYPSQAVYMVED